MQWMMQQTINDCTATTASASNRSLAHRRDMKRHSDKSLNCQFHSLFFTIATSLWVCLFLSLSPFCLSRLHCACFYICFTFALSSLKCNNFEFNFTICSQRIAVIIFHISRMTHRELVFCCFSWTVHYVSRSPFFYFCFVNASLHRIESSGMYTCDKRMTTKEKRIAQQERETEIVMQTLTQQQQQTCNGNFNRDRKKLTNVALA